MILSRSSLYWLAGWLEGEGSFTPGKPSAPNQPRIIATTTDRDIACRVADLLGVRPSNGVLRKHYKRLYRIEVKAARAVSLMKQLRPLMGARRIEQIDKALASFDPLKTRRRGEQHPFARFTEADIRAIRQDTRSGRAMAAAYGVNKSVIQHIIHRRTWRHVD